MIDGSIFSASYTGMVAKRTTKFSQQESKVQLLFDELEVSFCLVCLCHKLTNTSIIITKEVSFMHS